MEKAIAHVKIEFSTTCPYCKEDVDLKDNWEITEGHPLMEGMLMRFGAQPQEFPLISEQWIKDVKEAGYDNP